MNLKQINGREAAPCVWSVVVGLALLMSFSACTKKPEPIQEPKPDTSQAKPDEAIQPVAPEVVNLPEKVEPEVEPEPEVTEEKKDYVAEFEHRGAFSGDNGAEVDLYFAQEQGAWAMAVNEPSASAPYTLYMSGDPQDMEPVGMQTEIAFHGQPLVIEAKGDQLYGKVIANGRALEFYYDPDTGPRTALDGALGEGRDAPSEQIEMRMMVADIITSWKWMKLAKYHFENGELGMTYPPRQLNIPVENRQRVSLSEREVSQDAREARKMDLILNRPWDKGLGSFARKGDS